MKTEFVDSVILSAKKEMRPSPDDYLKHTNDNFTRDTLSFSVGKQKKFFDQIHTSRSKLPAPNTYDADRGLTGKDLFLPARMRKSPAIKFGGATERTREYMNLMRDVKPSMNRYTPRHNFTDHVSATFKNNGNTVFGKDK